jgi:aminoglycoside/choline kinase family phosphotransferase
MTVGDVVAGYELIEEIDGHGSERRFFRCRKDGVISVMVRDEEIERHLALQQHLTGCGIAVPQVYWFGIEERIMVQEDLGTVSLFELGKDGTFRDDIYRKAIDELIRLQIDARDRAPVECRYDREHVRWEQEYFRDHFLIQYCGLSAKETTDLEGDFETLGAAVLKINAPIDGYLMHRDYQSQNIYLKDNRIRLIDFQSARFGPLTYDLAALLRDAYVEIRPAQEKMLLMYYCDNIQHRGVDVTEDDFIKCYKITALQRGMQALGAFANLSINKNKPQFLRFIPRGLELLESGLKHTPFTRLKKVVSSIKG